MHLKRNIIDEMVPLGIDKFVLLGESVFNFHHSDDAYYEEWFEEIESGWIVALEFHEHVLQEWKDTGIDYYINFGGMDQFDSWRSKTPHQLCDEISQFIAQRLEG